MMSQSPLPLARESRVILIALVGLAALAWGLVIWQSLALHTSSSMSMSPGLTMGMGVWLFLAIWIAMMVAMMFPTSAPMVLMFAAISSGKRARGQTYVPTWIFVGGYLLVWSFAGVAAFALAAGLDWLASHSPWLVANAGRLGGATLVAAGLYQLSPLKNICLAKCRTPLQFLMTSWRDGSMGALRMGIEHGIYCLGCCWLLFVILFPLGMMNIAALALVTALIFAEKALPIGRRVSQLVGGGLICYGTVVAFAPAFLPH